MLFLLYTKYKHSDRQRQHLDFAFFEIEVGVSDRLGLEMAKKKALYSNRI